MTPAFSRAPKTIVTFLFLAYLLSASGRVSDEDSASMLAVTRSLLDGHLHIPGGAASVEGADGLRYSHYGLLTSIVWIPFVLLGRLGHALLGRLPAEQWEEFAVSFCAPSLALLTLLLLAAGWRRAQADPSHVRHGLWLFGLASLLWVYSKREGSDLLMAVCLLAAWLAGTRSNRPASLLLSGACLGAAWLARVPAPVLIAPISLALVQFHRRTARQSQSSPTAAPSASTPLRTLFWLGTGLAPFALAHLAYNHARFGHPLAQKYAFIEPYHFAFDSVRLQRLGGILLDGNHGLLLYLAVPIAVFAVAFPRLRRTQPELAWLIPTLAASQILLLSGYSFWGGSVCFGSRLFLFLVPFCALAWPDASLRPIAARLTVTAAAVTGLCLSLLGVLVHPVLPSMRTEFDGTWFPANHAREIARWVGIGWGAPSDRIRQSPEFAHRPLHVPDLWWCQALQTLRAPSPTHPPDAPAPR